MVSMFHSRSDLVKLLELAQCCIKSSSDKEEVDYVIELAKSIIPFTSLVICLDNFATLDPQASRRLLNYGYSSEWVDIYFRKSFHLQDPVLKLAEHETHAFSWGAGYANEAPSKEFLHLSRQFVGNNGIACCVSGRSRTSTTLISMTLPEREQAQDYVDALDYLAPHLHEIFNRQGSLNRHSLMAPEISQREIEVLHWAKEGKSTWDISNILSISERTVKFHFGNIFRKLDVLNRSQAIAKAIHFGVIAV
ncbi:DNA-binding transcriptional regulator, CsgD family [Pseudomonas sp. 8BK]|uniref:helix-turn-helix transcriptional regulator n=1 Tax=Pseudomonas TaxID=286 RepID=UPI0012F12206|nr:LuxR family transcriptional regulator [Pseudomonas sp. 8BK]VXB94913.1 DNA-binding transcriptional regulator, CsgD family [Pseudomonas sp. 8BK]